MNDEIFSGRLGIAWGPWQPLEDCWLGPSLSNECGLYRLRRAGQLNLDYVGQTGNLRRRLGMLRGVYVTEMPFRDPHTAAPALWALRHSGQVAFQVSVAPIEGPPPWRKGLEALTIARHRQEHGRSPTVQFGWMPVGFRASTGNNSKLVAAGKRLRGGFGEAADARHRQGTPPAGPLGGSPEGMDWGGHRWSSWCPIDEAARAAGSACGLYRIRGVASDGLLYIGEGRIGSRLRMHAAKTLRPGDRQGVIFSAAIALEASWVAGEWATNQRLELEIDLIAAHLLGTYRVPQAQFLG